MSRKKAAATTKWPADSVQRWSVDRLVPYARNARKHSDEQVAQIATSIEQFGFTIPVLVDDAGTIIAGHGRVMAAKALGLIEVPVMVAHGWTDEQKRAYVIADNRLAENASWDDDLLRLELADLKALEFNLDLTGFSPKEIDVFLAPLEEAETIDKAETTLAERFGVAPFSVLNAREGWWQDRKRAWLALGIQSEVGRGENLLRFSDTINEPDPEKRKAKNGKRKAATFGQDLMRGEHVVGQASEIPRGLVYGAMTMNDGAERTITGTSIFDPVLCELSYRWFSPPDGTILDPFAGGSVRGIVASRLGRRYVGVDLRPEQIDANRHQADVICVDPMPSWLVGDSRDIRRIAAGTEADMIFSCPPYADLEVYSDDPQDLSTLDYPDFREAYFRIVAEAAAMLKPDRFACFVVGEVRGKDGSYYGFVPDTIEAFERAGLRFYNEIILVTAAGSLPIRAGKQFEATRKIGKTHQNVLVFVKGDAKRATEAIGAVEFGAIDEEPEAVAAPAGGEWGERL